MIKNRQTIDRKAAWVEATRHLDDLFLEETYTPEPIEWELLEDSRAKEKSSTS